MIACLDADYRPGEVVTACVGIREWSDEAPSFERAEKTHAPAREYLPGQFYLREMPGILTLLEAARHEVTEPFRLIVIDGYVWLAQGRPGLGAHLFEALGESVPVVGVAKHSFHGNDAALPVTRGESTRPLYVTAAGTDPRAAADHVAQMHGDHRIPTILKRVDRLARES